MVKRARRKRDKILVPTASMGDIAFLIIIFFILTSIFAKSPIPIEDAQSKDIEKVKDIPKITVVIDEERQIFLDKSPVSNAKALETELAAKLVDIGSDKRVTAKVDKKVTQLKLYLDVIEAITEAGGTPVLSGENVD